MENGMLLELNGVTKSYGSAAAAEARILKGIDLKVSAGESIAIVGPSGSGKSTLLNIIGTLDHPTSGRVVLDGKDVSSLTGSRLAEVRSSVIGFVFQLHHLLPQCTVLENILVPTLVAKGSPDAEERARTLLDRVGLSHCLSRRIGQLSGGECQRVAVVRALINGPRLLLADEPTGSLDRESAESLAGLLFDLNREQGTALIVVTHAQDLAARAGRILQLRDGVLRHRIDE